MPYLHTHADAVADITMARQGFPRMAIGACFGGPLLSILQKSVVACASVTCIVVSILVARFVASQIFLNIVI